MYIYFIYFLRFPEQPMGGCSKGLKHALKRPVLVNWRRSFAGLLPALPALYARRTRGGKGVDRVKEAGNKISAPESLLGVTGCARRPISRVVSRYSTARAVTPNAPYFCCSAVGTSYSTSTAQCHVASGNCSTCHAKFNFIHCMRQG